MVLPSSHNASKRDSVLPKDLKVSFIACQGPTQDTRVHYLQMIFEQKVEIVVMLAQSKENEGRYIRYHEKYSVVRIRRKYSIWNTPNFIIFIFKMKSIGQKMRMKRKNINTCALQLSIKQKH